MYLTLKFFLGISIEPNTFLVWYEEMQLIKQVFPLPENPRIPESSPPRNSPLTSFNKSFLAKKFSFITDYNFEDINLSLLWKTPSLPKYVKFLNFISIKSIATLIKWKIKRFSSFSNYVYAWPKHASDCWKIILFQLVCNILSK